MFTGFASENTPAIQVWDLFNTVTGTNRIALADDCAPIQYFKTGGNTTAIQLFLPTAPIEGKQIQIVNARYAGNSQSISIFASDVSAGGTSNAVAPLGQGQTLIFCYSKNFISFGSSSGTRATGWITLNQSPAGAINSYAFVGGGNSNTASQLFAFVGGGNGNNASSFYSSLGGGQNNNASGNSSFLGGGGLNTASGSNSFVGCGNNNTANGEYSSIIGGSHGSTRSITGNTVAPASSNPIASSVGVTQSALLLLGRQTTDATATVLRSNTSAASTTNQVILPNNSAYVFQGTCIANVTGGSTTSGWKYEGVIKRGANAASTTLVAAVTPTVIAQDLAAATWVLAITADTTNGGIAVTVTGAAATTIRWVSTIETTEVTF